MEQLEFKFNAPIWVYSGKGALHFVTLPRDAADGIRFFNGSPKGFTPIAVKATIGDTTWKTSVFPDKKSGSYLLAIKAAVRKAENIGDGDVVAVRITMAVHG